MAIFNTTRLAGQQLLVTGNTEQSVILDTAEWDEVKAHLSVDQAGAEYDKAVQEFFAPLFAAVDKVEAANAPKVDPAFHVLIHEGQEATEGSPEVIADLSTEAAIVRMLDEGDTSRLIWVGNDRIAILAPEDGAEEEVAESNLSEVVSDIVTNYVGD